MNGGSAAAAAQSHDSFTDGHHVRLLYCSRTSGALRRTTTTTPYNTISLWPHAHDEIHFWNPVTGVFVNYLGKLSLIFEGETLKLSSSWDQTAWTTGSPSTFVVRGKLFLNFPPLRPDGRGCYKGGGQHHQYKGGRQVSRAALEGRGGINLPSHPPTLSV